MKEEKLAGMTSAAVTDPTAGVERTLLVNSRGSVVKRGETELVMALFEPPRAGGERLLQNQSTSRDQLSDHSACGLRDSRERKSSVGRG